MSYKTPSCPTDCGFTLPIVDFSICSPTITFGEITHIYVASGDANPFTDVEDITEWNVRLSDTSLDDDMIRDLMVLADLPAASAEEIVISLGRKIYSPATHTINVDIDDVSQETYEFARTTSCNAQFRVWFATPSWIFGGNDGILANINLRPVIERGIKSINKLSGTVTWEHQFSAERHVNPFATT